MRVTSIAPVFVEYIPETLADGSLYISIRYGTAVHKCCCGCGNEVVTPLTSTDWTLSFNGETVSLTPSIGNWSFPCQSHYWITQNRVRIAPPWTREEIAAGREIDRVAKAEYEGSREDSLNATFGKQVSMPWWRRAWAKLFRK